MISNSINNTQSFQQMNIDRLKESQEEARQVFEKEAPIVNQATSNSNELTRKDTVNEVELTNNTDNINKNQEVNKEVVQERGQIQKGQLSADSALGQNIDVTV